MSIAENVRATIAAIDDQCSRGLLPTYTELVEALRKCRPHVGWCISSQQAKCEAAQAEADSILARIPKE